MIDNNFSFEQIKIMVEGAYKKLKSFLFYDKTLLFAKKRLVEFECNRESFIKNLDLLEKSIYNHDNNYFDKLIEQISFHILPKKFNPITSDSKIISSTANHNQVITKVNFFIDMPTELQILDFLWTLLLGKISVKYPNIYKYAAATKFKKSLYNDSLDLFEGIDFQSNRCFEPYYSLYTGWRDGAFKKIKKLYNTEDTYLLCLDLKSFYYSVAFSFENISEYLQEDERLNRISYLTNLIEKIYRTYSNLLIKYKKGIIRQGNSCVFPIGVTSVYVLREIYLHKFDKDIVEKLSPQYYNRYVDDILIVINDESFTQKKVEDYLLWKEVISNSDGVDLKFYGYPNLRMQSDKISCFSFLKDDNPILLDIYSSVIKENSSESNLLPDFDILNTPFTSKAYNIQNFEFSNKIRDLGFVLNNNYKATKYLGALLRLIKNVELDGASMSAYFDQIEEVYRGSQSIEYSANWRMLFEIYLLCNEKKRAWSMYKYIRSEIDKINLDNLDSNEILQKGKTYLTRKIKDDLRLKLKISIALTGALKLDFVKHQDLLELAFKVRQSNMLNHNCVSYPLLNYSNLNDVSLTEKNLSVIFDCDGVPFKLDDFMLKWTPRYINAIEFEMAYLFHTICIGRGSYEINEILQKYSNYNHLLWDENKKLNYEFESGGIIKHLKSFRGFKKNQKSPKVALVNTKITKEEAIEVLFEPNGKLTISEKKKLFKILNIAKEERVNFIVFPEFYFPIAWLLDIALYAIKNDITIITGLQYIRLKNKVLNYVCNVIPAKWGRKFKYGILLLREKNYYAPIERLEFAKLGYKCYDRAIPVYDLVEQEDYSYSTILCYEFTDIHSRAEMKAKIEMLFVPQLNQDTNYFSSIVDSSARDLHCFIIQANTSEYGDSRITAPYDTLNKNILQIKGGETDVVMISTVDISSLQNYRWEYSKKLDEIENRCLNCKKRNKKKLKQFYETKCANCKNKLVKKVIKGTPPGFH